MTSLEEVFLKLGEEAAEEEADEEGRGASGTGVVAGAIMSPDAISPTSSTTAGTTNSNVSSGDSRHGVVAGAGPRDEGVTTTITQQEQAPLSYSSPYEPSTLAVPPRTPTSTCTQVWAIAVTRWLLLINNRKGTFMQFVYPLLLQLLILGLRIGYTPSSDGGGGNNPADQVKPILSVIVLITFVGTISSQYVVAFVAQIMQDKTQRCKHLIFSFGLRPLPFWLGTFFSHYFVLLIAYLILPVAIQVQQLKPYVDMPGEPNPAGGAPIPPFLIPKVFDLLPVSIFLLYLAAFTATGATLLWGYCVSNFFSRQETALKMVPVTLTLSSLGSLILVVVFLLQGVVDPSKRDIGWALHVGFSLTIPSYGMTGTMIYMAYFATIERLQGPVETGLVELRDDLAGTNSLLGGVLAELESEGWLRGRGFAGDSFAGGSRRGGPTQSWDSWGLPRAENPLSSWNKPWTTSSGSPPGRRPETFDLPQDLQLGSSFSLLREVGVMPPVLHAFAQRVSSRFGSRKKTVTPADRDLIEQLKQVVSHFTALHGDVASPLARWSVSFKKFEEAEAEELLFELETTSASTEDAVQGQELHVDQLLDLDQLSDGRPQERPPRRLKKSTRALRKLLGRLRQSETIATVTDWLDPGNGMSWGVLGGLVQIVFYSLALMILEYLDYNRRSCRLCFCMKR